jgi:hypothetical protein
MTKSHACSQKTTADDIPAPGGGQISTKRASKSGPPVTREFSRNQKSKRKIKNAFQNLREVAKTAGFIAKTLKNAKNTPLCSVLIFDFNLKENQIYSKIQRYEDTKNDATMQRRNEDTKKQRFKEKEKNL